MKKAVALLSGGFDSMLAIRIMQKQGFEVEGFNIQTPFCDTSREAQQAADDLGITCCCQQVDASYLEILRQPRFGYGKGVNPCLDCHLYMIHMAKKRMEETQADIVITGEVLGQRPMSQQRHHLEMLDYHSGLAGRLIRPICAKLLPPTEAERNGLVDREQLYGLHGRGRTALHQLGHDLGIPRIVRAMAGCSLTERSFAPRVRDLLRHEDSRTEMWEYAILRYGRHIRYDETTRCVLGRNERDCDYLWETYQNQGRFREDVVYWFPESYTGPSVMLIGETGDEQLDFARELQVFYSKNAVSGEIVLRKFHQQTELLESFEPSGRFQEKSFRTL